MASDKDGITVMVGLFSGRPNPEFTLTGKAADDFINLAKQGVGKEPANPPPAPRLGEFYGFFVKVPAERAKSAGLPAEFSIFKGVVTEQIGREAKHWRDAGNLEQNLIQRAYDAGHGDLLKMVGMSGPERSS